MEAIQPKLQVELKCASNFQNDVKSSLSANQMVPKIKIPAPSRHYANPPPCPFPLEPPSNW